MEKRVLVIMETPLVHNWQILRGINQYETETRCNWAIRLCQNSGEIKPLVQEWKPHGLINQLAQEKPFMAGKGIACVHISANVANPFMPSCCHDHFAIGAAAASYFLERGFRHFAYLAFYTVRESKNRASLDRFGGYSHVLGEAGHSVDVIENAKVTGPWYTLGTTDAIHQLSQQLKALPHPLALFTFNDQAAYSAVEACRHAGLSVPEDVAILGVDNDAGICESAAVPISSIPPQHEKQGWLAAEMLDEQMSGRVLRENRRLLEPLEVATRTSTSIFSVEDESLKKALQFIRHHLHGKIGVNDICHATGLSRSLLDKRFRKVLKRSPLEEVHRQRIERVMHLLASSDRTTEEIAAETGFTDPFQMYKLFKKKSGMTPRQYRLRSRI